MPCRPIADEKRCGSHKGQKDGFDIKIDDLGEDLGGGSDGEGHSDCGVLVVEDDASCLYHGEDDGEHHHQKEEEDQEIEGSVGGIFHELFVEGEGDEAFQSQETG